MSLRELVRARGYFEKPSAPVVLAWCAHCALGLAALLVCVLSHHWFVISVSLLVSTFGFTGIGTLGHMASHGASFRSPLHNQIMYLVSYPLMLQVSATYWTHNHVQLHHPSPNVLGRDEDCDLRPLFALNEEHLRSMPHWWRDSPALRGVAVLILLPLNGFSIILQGWTHLVRSLVQSRGRRLGAWLDLACMASHLGLWLALPMLFFGARDVIALYVLRVMLIGTGLFAILAPGHFPAEAACLAFDQRGPSRFYLRQAATTINFRTGWLGRFVCSGLECQIEHHFFPNVSHVHLRAMQPIVETYCVQQGIPYRRFTWLNAIRKSCLSFVVPKVVVSDIDSLWQSSTSPPTCEETSLGSDLPPVTDGNPR